MKTESIKKNIFISTIYQALTIIIPFITAPYISRVIGDHGIGVYSYTNSVQTYFSMLAALGTVSYGTREIARVRNDKKLRSKLFWEIELLTFLSTFIILVVWAVFVFFTPAYKYIYLVLSINIIAVAVDVSWFFSGLEQFKYLIRQNAIVKLLGVGLLFIFVKTSDDLLIYIAIMVLSSFFGTCSMWFYLKKFLTKIEVGELNIWPHLKESMFYFIPTIATSIYTVLDKTLIGLITNNPYENGYYEQTTKIINMIKSITFSAVNSVLGSRIAYLFYQNKFEEIKEKIAESLDYILFIGIGSFCGVFAIANTFVPIFFGAGYEPVIGMLRLMSPIVIIIGISNCLGSQYYTPGGYRKKSAFYICIGAGVNLLCNIFLIPIWNANGAVLGSIIAELTITILYVRNCNNYLNAIQIWKLSWKKMISGLIMIVIVCLLESCMELSFLKLFIEIMIGGSVYCLLLFVMKDSSILIFRKIFKRKEN